MDQENRIPQLSGEAENLTPLRRGRVPTGSRRERVRLDPGGEERALGVEGRRIKFGDSWMIKTKLRLEGVMGLWLQRWGIRLRVGTSILPRIPKSPPTECRKTPATFYPLFDYESSSAGVVQMKVRVVAAMIITSACCYTPLHW